MIEADDLEPASPCLSSPVDVILRVDDISRRGGPGDIARPHGLDDFVATAEQEATAFVRHRLSRMRHQTLVKVARYCHFDP